MSKITESARGEQCQVRIPSYCNYRPETTVFAHKNGAGMGTKANDMHGAYACSRCHDVIDGRVKTNYNKDHLKLWFYESIFRTNLLLIEKGLINVCK